MTPKQEVERALNRANVCETIDIVESIIDHHGLDTVLAMAGSICAKRAQEVLKDWQDAPTAQRHEVSRAALAEANQKVMEFGLA